MFCKHCGKEIKEGNKFCNFCGQILSPETSTEEKKSWVGYVWKSLLVLAIIVAVGLYAFSYLGDYAPEDNDTFSLLNELDPTIQPVGYFDDPDVFESETISDKDWLSYVKYTEPINLTPIAISNSRFPDQYNTYSSVVKIVCEDNDYYYYGSGTNVDSAGYVVTNLHVIEGNTDLECVVGFPDPETGLIREAYWATPVIDNENETGHDLAMLSVEKPVFDDEYNIYGFYEKFTDGTFPYYEETDACLNTAPQLGDQVFVLGYPALSGGALTITDGLVSSLYSADGYIITSAKIGSGNSGGLAVDSSNCFVGVPTAVYSDGQDENYGEIIDAYFVYEFFKAVSDDLEKYASEFNDVVVEHSDRPATLVESGRLAYLTVPGALRSCASTNCEIIRYYAEGAKVTVEEIDSTQNWYEVTARDDYGNPISGYMHKSLFE